MRNGNEEMRNRNEEMRPSLGKLVYASHKLVSRIYDFLSQEIRAVLTLSRMMDSRLTSTRSDSEVV